MSNPVIAYAAIFGPALIIGAVIGLGGRWCARGLTSPAPDDGYQQVRSMLCTWCKPVPRGLCSCENRCGHVRCVHLPARGWMPDDRDILQGKRLP